MFSKIILKSMSVASFEYILFSYLKLWGSCTLWRLEYDLMFTYLSLLAAKRQLQFFFILSPAIHSFTFPSSPYIKLSFLSTVEPPPKTQHTLYFLPGLILIVSTIVWPSLDAFVVSWPSHITQWIKKHTFLKLTCHPHYSKKKILHCTCYSMLVMKNWTMIWRN